MFCYVTMPFSLKNARATYQRCMLQVFGDLIGRTVEAYVDDIVVKSRRASGLVADLDETFWAKGIRLNPEKCVFGVPRGMLLGFIVCERGIEANPEKVSAIANMGPIRNLKGVQRVMGCLESLSRFISLSGRKDYLCIGSLENLSIFTGPLRPRKPLTSSRLCLPILPSWYPPPRGNHCSSTSQLPTRWPRSYRGQKKGRRACPIGPKAGVLH